MKKKSPFLIIPAVALLSGAYTAHAATVTADNFAWFTGAFSAINEFLGLLVPLLISLAVILFLWGMMVFMLNTDSEQGRENGKSKMIWGIVIIFVMLSVWGFVEILDTIFNLDNVTVPDGPNVTF